METKINNTFLEIVEGDITEMSTEAIVNAANSYLKHGGGVAGAIVRKGGKIIQEESDKIGYCPVGSAVITGAGNLKAKYVIHAVGPRMGEGDEDTKLKSATVRSLELAEAKGIESIAFPAISTGIFGFPLKRCGEIMLSTVIEYLSNRKTVLRRVVFCLFGKEAYNIFVDELFNQLKSLKS